MEAKDTKTSPDDTQFEKIASRPKSSRKRRIIIFTVVSLLNAGLLILLWSQLLTPASNQQASTGGTVPGPLLGHAAPDFRLAVLTSRPARVIDLASFKGKPVVLDFWSSSCAPCQDEAPMLQAAWQHAQSKGIVFIGIDFQDPQSDGLGFLQQYHVTYLNALDSDGSTAIHYGVTYTPTTFFINRQGIIVRSIGQEMTAQQLQSGLQLLQV